MVIHTRRGCPMSIPIFLGDIGPQLSLTALSLSALGIRVMQVHKMNWEMLISLLFPGFPGRDCIKSVLVI